MVATPSTMVGLGTKAHPFRLPDPRTGQIFDFSDSAESKGYLIAFICNHCPYVIHLLPELTRLCKMWQSEGLEIVFVSSNDVENYPADAPHLMKELAEKHQFSFPYLYDEHQTIALSYRAACTPDFFLYDLAFSLFYRGQFDDSRPSNELVVTGKDLSGAVNRLLSKLSPPETQYPSLGCNLKWKKGNEPDYFKPKK